MEILFNSVDEFTQALKKEGVTKVVFAETSEMRALQTTHEEVSLQSYRLLELLAYKKPSLYKMTISDPDFTAIHRRLTAEGFELTKKVRNIT